MAWHGVTPMPKCGHMGVNFQRLAWLVGGLKLIQLIHGGGTFISKLQIYVSVFSFQSGTRTVHSQCLHSNHGLSVTDGIVL